MNQTELKERFHQKVFPSHPNEWEVDDVLQDLGDLAEEQQNILLHSVPAIWPISHSLCYSFLHEGSRHVEELGSLKLAEWLRRILDNYEEGGLKKARSYMAAADKVLIGETAETVQPALLAGNWTRLTSYARGISGFDLDLQSSETIYTDTETIYLPEVIDYFSDEEENLLFYRLIISLQCAFIRLGTFGPAILTAQEDGMNSCFEKFENPLLAKDLFQLVEVGRAVSFMEKNYPGLMRQSHGMRRQLIHSRSAAPNDKNMVMESIFSRVFLPDTFTVEIDQCPIKNFTCLESAEQSLKHVPLLFEYVMERDGGYKEMSLLPFMDCFSYEKVQRTAKKRIAANKKKFETILSRFLVKNNIATQSGSERNFTEVSTDSVKLQFFDGLSEHAEKKKSATLTINNKRVDLPDELTELTRQISMDLGELPQGYVSAAFGLAGAGKPPQEGAAESGGETILVQEFQPYDEWDYRRQGYRKDWCSLRERRLQGVRSDFVGRTRDKYRGPLKKIRRQFEALRTQERFARRRRHGDDIDLDALVDSLGDQRAGLPPSEHLFIRLLRNERSISTLFLVDMSNSTEGWIGVAIKESLVLLCEAMEMVGDRYGIYGFSGMRRSRSEVYAIKELAEKYGEEVTARIGAISPKEYTRMGPPIRHMIQHFSGLESKTRLLIILSDGKPEDYDDYKGQYAIEDTRKALAEAKGAGINTFCITIDQEAHTYLQHLFGNGNYIFVQDIERLPSKLTEIYRLLTR